MQRERALAGEAESLRRLLDLRDRSQMPTVAAEVIGTSPAADFRSVTIDRGTSDGVQTDMAVDLAGRRRRAGRDRCRPTRPRCSS